MDRRDFLAFIPTISAIGFTAKNIIQEKKEIIIQEPKPIEVVHTIDEHLKDDDVKIDRSLYKVLLCYNNRVIGSANMDSLGVSSGILHEVSVSIPVYRNPVIRVTAEFDEPSLFKNLEKAARI